MIRERKSPVALRACTDCGRPPLLCEDRRHGGRFFIDDPRCGRRTALQPTPDLAIADWGTERPRVRGVLTLPSTRHSA